MRNFFSTLALVAILAPVCLFCPGLRVQCSEEFSMGRKFTEAEFKALREKMVREQIQDRGIHDPRVLAALLEVPRHMFVPESIRSSSYEDRPLPIGLGQTISQPYIVALMTELLELKGGERVLEIGTGSGYQAAILSRLAKEVYTIEILEPLATRAKRILQELGCKNVQVKAGDGYHGWKEHAPYEAIIVTAAPESVPQPLADQLAEGGRLVIPVGHEGGYQTLWQIVKKKGRLQYKNKGDVLFVPFIREDR